MTPPEGARIMALILDPDLGGEQPPPLNSVAPLGETHDISCRRPGSRPLEPRQAIVGTGIARPGVDSAPEPAWGATSSCSSENASTPREADLDKV